MNIWFNFVLSIIVGLFIISSAYLVISINASKPKSHVEPSFISTKFNKTNLRSGNSLDYPVIHIYEQKNLPLEVTGSSSQWYSIKDIQGREGWIHKNVVSLAKYAFVLEQEKVYLKKNTNSKIIAIIDPLTIVLIDKCYNKQNLCFISFFVPQENLDYSGWISQSSLWGNTGEK